MPRRGVDRLRRRIGRAPGGDECRPDDEEHHPEGAGGVEPEGHRRDIGAAAASRQPERQPGEEQVADDHADRRARHEMREGEIDRIPEDGRQQRHREHEVGKIVERQPEEGVDITGAGPAVGERGRRENAR